MRRWLYLAAIALVPALWVLLPQVQQPGTPTVLAQGPAPVPVGLQPADLTLAVGQTATVAVQVGAGATNLYGAQFGLSSSDPAVAEIVSVAPGPLLAGSGAAEVAGGFFSASEIAPAGDAVSFAITLLNPAAAVTGPGDLALVEIACQAEGTATLDFSLFLLADQDSFEIPASVPSPAGEVTCGEEAPVCGDLTGDRLVNVFDPITGLRGIVGVIELTQQQLALGNVVLDQSFNIQDVILIMRHIVGLAQITGCGQVQPPGE